MAGRQPLIKSCSQTGKGKKVFQKMLLEHMFTRLEGLNMGIKIGGILFLFCDVCLSQFTYTNKCYKLNTVYDLVTYFFIYFFLFLRKREDRVEGEEDRVMFSFTV